MAAGFCLWMESRPQFEVRRLQPLLAELEGLQVKVWRDQDWCRCFQYQGGAFMWSTNESTCSLFSEKASSFSDKSNDDFRRIREAVRKTRCRLNYVTARYSQGHVVEAEFSLDSGFLRQAYVYSLNPPEDMGREVWHQPLGGPWYLRNEDWN